MVSFQGNFLYPNLSKLIIINFIKYSDNQNMLVCPFWITNNYCVICGTSHFTNPSLMRLTCSYCTRLDPQIGEAIKKGLRSDLFLHYIFMDNAFELPTGLGLQLQISSSGVITPGIRGGMKLEVANVRSCSLF